MFDEDYDMNDFEKDFNDLNEYVLGWVGGYNVVLVWLLGE